MLTDEQFGRELGGRLRHETRDVHAAPDLVGTLRRRQARWSRAIRAGMATPVVAMAAAAILVTSGVQGVPGGQDRTDAAPPPVGNGAVRLENVAYVKTQTIRAMSRASEYVIYARSTDGFGRFDQWFDNATQRYRLDWYQHDRAVGTGPGRGSAPPAEQDHPAGLLHSTTITGPERRRDVLTVYYHDKQWWRGSVAGARFPFTTEYSTDPDSLRKALAEGKLELLGEERVDGIDTLHLRLDNPRSGSRVDLWVDDKTYLPVREIKMLLPVPGTAKGNLGKTGGRLAPLTTKYSWLPRTEENLARLVLTPPPGYKQVK